jgi:hypothetical protein
LGDPVNNDIVNLRIGRDCAGGACATAAGEINIRA